ncbi:MAG: hypothetical protein JXB85_05340 [Anaerolineales bacterium]|nr:hypothetical protein [Anaerolineales bacterium]
MKGKLSQINLFVSKINRQHVQIILVLLTLALFVLGAGAPDDGGIGPR